MEMRTRYLNAQVIVTAMSVTVSRHMEFTVQVSKILSFYMKAIAMQF